MIALAPWSTSHRLVISGVIALIVTGWLFYLCTKPKSARPLTWARAMLGAVGAFGMMILVYGVVPDEWMQFADSELEWSEARIWTEVGPVTINFRAVKDTVAVLIYVAFFAAQIALAVLWQKRKPAQEVPASEPVAAGAGARPAGFSRFGRPLSRKA